MILSPGFHGLRIWERSTWVLLAPMKFAVGFGQVFWWLDPLSRGLSYSDGHLVPAISRGVGEASVPSTVWRSHTMCHNAWQLLSPRASRSTIWVSGPQLGGSFAPSPQGHSAMSGDICYSYSWARGAPGIEQVETRVAAKPLTMHRTAAQHKGLSGPKC